jgi:4a-hydroxytetrahydrobiopterin dehydratase
MQPPETIDAGELVLKRWQPEWADEAVAAVRESLPELKPFLPWAGDDYDAAASHAFITTSLSGWDEGREFNYAILTTAGDLVGSIGLMTRMGPGVLEIGYWTRTSSAGRGYMTAAVNAVAGVALTLPGIDRVAIRHDAANAASAAVAAKAGFTEVERIDREPQAPGETGTDVIRERRARAKRRRTGDGSTDPGSAPRAGLRQDVLMTTLTGQQIADESPAGWVLLLGGLQTRLHTADFATGLTVVNAIGAAAEEANHHPDVDLRYAHVDVRLTSHDAGGVTGRDTGLARRISAIAADAGVRAEGDSLSRVELALDSPAYRSVAPFWAAVLAMEEPAGQDDEIRDPFGALPAVWFQPSGSEEPRQRWHPDVWVDPAQVQPRIDAAVKAGGSLVSDAEAPSFWVLADAEGNKVCLCTWKDRDRDA